MHQPNSTASIMNKALLTFLLVIYACFADYIYAQTPADSIKRLAAQIDTLGNRIAAESLYLQTDKPYYALGDTLWFKAYLLHAGELTASATSGVMYVELVNSSNKIEASLKLPVWMGVSWGSVALDEANLQAGIYTLRAYTTWMQNNLHNKYFSKTINISTANPKSWLVNYSPALTVKLPGTQLSLNMQIVQANKIPVSAEDVQLNIKQGTKVVSRNKLKTMVDGGLKLGVNLPPQTDLKNLSIEIGSTKDQDQKLIFPIGVVQAKEIDLQFMPEGGYMVAGLPARVGFKAVNQQGKGIDIEGEIYNSKKQQIITFSSQFKGIGVFNFLPEPGETYTAIVSSGAVKGQEFKLPLIKQSGISMQVITRYQAKENFSAISIQATPDVAGQNQTYYLIGHSGRRVYYAGVISLKKRVVEGKLPLNNYPSGVGCITLFNSKQQPVVERTIFVDKRDQLRLKVTPHQSAYNSRDSIAIKIAVTDQDDKPVKGSYSLAVTDDAQVNTTYSLNGNIKAQMLLSAGIKGDIEDPDHYFNQPSFMQTQDLDNLMLTQGWSGYNWDDVFKPVALTYRAELQPLITGKVTNVFNKPVINSKLVLLSTKPFFMRDTITDKQGRFSFASLPVLDSATAFMLQARNARGKSFNVGIEVDEVKLPSFADVGNQVMPWYINTDTIILNNAKTSRIHQANQQNIIAGTLLKAVGVTAKKVVKESSNLNGAGNADIVLDEKDMAKVGELTLLQLLQQRVKGFREGVPPKGTNLEYWVNFNRLKLVFDGIEVDRFFEPIGLHNEHYNYLRNLLEYYTANDIKGIEVMHSNQYNSRYNSTYLTFEELMNVGALINYTYIEITTYGKSGPFMRKTPGTYVYRYVPYALPKLFYSPKYKADKPITTPDLRSTIHWEPNIMTDANGEAKVSFYSADQLGNYTFILEGSDLAGHVGRQTGKIKIKTKPGS
jgi:hypothetical protein